MREERAAALATLIRHVGDFQLAEDAVQVAFAAAVATWPSGGVPANPGAWLTVTARRRAIDRLRRDRSIADRADRLAELARLDAQEHHAVTEEESTVEDDRLRLIFSRTLCDHGRIREGRRALERAMRLRRPGLLTAGRRRPAEGSAVAHPALAVGAESA